MVRDRVRQVRLLPAGTAGGPERPLGAGRPQSTWGCTDRVVPDQMRDFHAKCVRIYRERRQTAGNPQRE